ncbi:MAG: thiamine phosphate synthase [Candidatus Sedimenticola endophacoides]
MTQPLPRRGLYAITDPALAAGQGLDNQVRHALRAGTRLIQYRDKSGDAGKRLREARELLALCRNHGAALIINDDADLALEIGADGVHLGRDDPDLRATRARLGTRRIIGVSCYNRFDLALEAQREGADYVAFGRFFPSSSKPGAVQADPALLHRARRELGIPAVAIGGITPENGGALIEAGANMLAVIHGVFGQPDIAAACTAFHRLFEQTEVSAP